MSNNTGEYQDPGKHPRIEAIREKYRHQAYNERNQPIGGGANCAKVEPSPIAKASQLLAADAEHRSLAADQIMMLKMVMPTVRENWRQLSEGLYRWFQHQGFWSKAWDMRYSASDSDMVTIPAKEYIRLKKMEKLGLIVTEVAETMEAVRKGDGMNELEELADTKVRIFDYEGGFGLANVAGEAFERKMIANYSRPFKHGKEF